MPNWTLALVIGLAVIALLLFIREFRIGRTWRAQQREVASILETDDEKLADEHPNMLRDRLRTAREVEANHHALSRQERVSQSLRQAAHNREAEARKAIEKISAAMESSVKSRGERGMVTATRPRLEKIQKEATQ